jgi:hypothetical protein
VVSYPWAPDEPGTVGYLESTGHGQTFQDVRSSAGYGHFMVKVFLSWSGDRSKIIANELKRWLPFVINDVEPFVSMNIEAGARWQEVISLELEATQFGIVIVTRENQESRWLNFEAGALAKAVDASRVVPLAVNLELSEIRQPLGQFQAQSLNSDGVLAILKMINDRCATKLTMEHLETAFDRWWSDMEAVIQEALQLDTSSIETKEDVPDEHEIMSEILDTVRQLARSNVSRRTPRQRLAGEKLDEDEVNIVRSLFGIARGSGLTIYAPRFIAPNIIELTSDHDPPTMLIDGMRDIAQLHDLDLRIVSKSTVDK